MNPYDFVRLAGEPDRAAAPGRLRFQGTAGSISCLLTVRTPLFTYQPSSARWVDLPDGARHEEVSFPLREGRPVVPASSLKGMLRSVAEAASRSCVSIFEGRYERGPVHRDMQSLLPISFRRCQRPEALCPACRIFGTGQQAAGSGSPLAPALMSAPSLWSGVVAISDAIAVEGAYLTAEPFTLATESPPKPHHEAFYLMSGRLSGRKFYVHQPQGTQPSTERTAENRTIEPLVPGSKLRFTVDYELLSDDDRRLLLYSLVLESGLAHKLGLGKPLGLGSTHITIERMTTVDAAARYRAGGQAAVETIEGDTLEPFLDDQLRPFRTSQTFFLLDLRRVLRFEHREAVAYPSAAWFAANPTVTLRQVNAPGQRAGMPPLPTLEPRPFEPARTGSPSARPAPPPRRMPDRVQPTAPLREPSLPTAPPPRQVSPVQPRQAAPTPASRPAAAELEREPEADRAFTMADLLERFGKGNEEAPEPASQPDQGRKRMTRADRAREDQRRLVERLRRGQPEE